MKLFNINGTFSVKLKQCEAILNLPQFDRVFICAYHQIFKYILFLQNKFPFYKVNNNTMLTSQIPHLLYCTVQYQRLFYSALAIQLIF